MAPGTRSAVTWGRFAALLFALCLALPVSATAAPREGCDDPAKPHRLKLDPVNLIVPDDIYKAEEVRLSRVLERAPGHPGDLSLEALLGFISRSEVELRDAQRAFAKGVACVNAGDSDSARFYFLEATRLEARYWPAYAGLYVVTPGDKATIAVELFRKAQSREPLAPEPYNAIAAYQALIRAQHAAAVETLERGIAKIPNAPDYLYQNQAGFIIASPEYPNLLPTLERDAAYLAKRGQGQVNLYINGAYRYLTGDFAGSAKFFRTLAEKFPDNMPGRYGLAEASYCAGDYAGALENGEKALKLMIDSEVRNKFIRRLESYRRDAAAVKSSSGGPTAGKAEE